MAGSAISLLSCAEGPKSSETNDEALISRIVRNMEVISTENGIKKELMRAPLVEEHAFAHNAYSEFPQGIEEIGYDSLGRPSSRVVADHALHWTDRDLWQLKGNVLVEGDQGQKLYTQQLYWDRKIKKIWSNVDGKVDNDGDVLYFTRFEALDDFSRWTSHDVTGTVGMDVEPTEPPADSTAISDPTPPPMPPMPPDSLDPAALPSPPAPPADSLTVEP